MVSDFQDWLWARKANGYCVVYCKDDFFEVIPTDYERLHQEMFSSDKKYIEFTTISGVTVTHDRRELIGLAFFPIEYIKLLEADFREQAMKE